MPDKNFKFPSVTDSSGRNRSFQWKWLTEYPGLVYSPELGGGLCKHCVLFSKDSLYGSGQLGILVSRPFNDFRKATETLRKHFVGNDGRGKLSRACHV